MKKIPIVMYLPGNLEFELFINGVLVLTSKDGDVRLINEGGVKENEIVFEKSLTTNPQPTPTSPLDRENEIWFNAFRFLLEEYYAEIDLNLAGFIETASVADLELVLLDARFADMFPAKRKAKRWPHEHAERYLIRLKALFEFGKVKKLWKYATDFFEALGLGHIKSSSRFLSGYMYRLDTPQLIQKAMSLLLQDE